MNRFLRIVPRVCRSAFASSISPHEDSRIPLRVGLLEADWAFAHQAQAPLYLELGRWDFALRCGLARWMLKRRCAGVLGTQIIRYHRPLKRWQRFELNTRLATWDEKWLYMKQRIEVAGKCHVSAGVRVLFVDEQRRQVPPSEALAATGAKQRLPPHYADAQLLNDFGRNPSD